MKILLLSPYDAVSHRYWREGLVAAFPEHEFRVLTLPPRYFAWRFRGNGLSLSRQAGMREPFDLLIATSMTDLATLRGLVPGLATVPNVVYWHENQFAYPDRQADPHRLEQQITSLYTALAADRLVFNSAWNRDTFLNGARDMLDRMPDHVPAGVIDSLAARASILPVPLAADAFDPVGREGGGQGSLEVVWNHRWEYDKGPGELRDIVRGLINREADIIFHIVGQSFRDRPAEIVEACELLDRAGRLGRSGYLPRPEYLDLLHRSHVVLSTARHEFQGLAVLEAVAAGCVPVVPDRLAYVELFDAQYRYSSIDEAIDRIGNLSWRVSTAQQNIEGEVPDVTRLGWPAQRSAWAAVINFEGWRASTSSTIR